jgi:dienelactone hydrolase
MNAIKHSIFLAAIIFTGVSASAQSGELCQGEYYTEQQGADHLASLLKRMHSKEDWKKHADSARAQLRKGMELTVFPQKTPLNPRYRNKKVLDGYSVESVVFESLPGFFVTGNLYKPTGNLKKKSLAAILCPHGHFPDPNDYARFRKDMQIRCASMARMGAVVFAYDMVGWGESIQVEHTYNKVLAFQTWNSIRAIDFLLSLPEADPERVAVTGASGGGTQTFMVAALDDRVKLSLPVVMVSSHFFGGCMCESGMPVHKNGNTVYTNAEIACVVAPKPMLWVSDGSDWTKNNETVEYPFAKAIYKLYDKEDMVANVHFATEGHDYGKNKRRAAYDFLAKNLGLKLQNITDKKGEVSEDFVTILDRKQLTYFSPEELTPLIKGDQVYKVFKQSQASK